MKLFIGTILTIMASLFVASLASAHGVDHGTMALSTGLATGLGSLAMIGMAKVSGPLMSMQASGAFAKTLVFANRKGQNVVRQLVIPANPMSADQETARNMIRTAGAGQHYANLEINIVAARVVTDKAALISATPAGQTWNSYLVKAMIGVGGVTYDAAQAAWTLLTALQKSDWDDAAAALTPPIAAVAQKGAGGVAAVALTGGNVDYIYQYGLYSVGLAAAPGAVPPVYA